MNQILEGNVLDTLATIPAGSIDCAVTSPPYWQMRSYLPKGHALKPLELGLEPTPGEYIANMIEVFRLVRRALADHGMCWVNIGDTYASGEMGRNDLRAGGVRERPKNCGDREIHRLQPGTPAGSLCLVPQRLAIALQDDGWIVRSVVVWHKPAPMPASLAGWMWKRCRVKVKAGQIHSGRLESGNSDRPFHMGDAAANGLTAQWSDCPGCKKCLPNGRFVLRRGSWRPASSWEPILMLAKSSSYYGDGEPVKTPSTGDKRSSFTDERDLMYDEDISQKDRDECSSANLRDVWTIAAEPLKEKHYAAFPTELVRRCLLSGTSSKGYCPTCGAPWARVVSAAFVPNGRGPAGAQKGCDESNGWTGYESGSTETKTLGWRPTCSCPPAEPRCGRVLDPFCGSGRTGIVAMRLGLDFTGCELNPDYVVMAKRIWQDENPLFGGASFPADEPICI